MAFRKLRIDSPDLGYLLSAVEEAEKAINSISAMEGYIGAVADDLLAVESTLGEIARHAVQALRRQVLTEAEKQRDTIEKAKEESPSKTVKEAAMRLVLKLPHR